MSKLRLLFIKEAQASYISHLDLLRTFQRAFPRTELDIKHSQRPAGAGLLSRRPSRAGADISAGGPDTGVR